MAGLAPVFGIFRFGPGTEKPRRGEPSYVPCPTEHGWSNGLFDGFRIDNEDRIWTSAADGVHCYNAVGALIGKIKIPEIVSNVCFGGERLNRLFITGTTSLYSAYLAVNGIC